MKTTKHIINIIAFFVIFAMTMSGCKKENIKPIDSVSVITKPVTEITLTFYTLATDGMSRRF